jgi:hypothetical protein
MAAYPNEMYGERRVPGVLAPSRGLGVRDADVVRLPLVRADPADTASGGALRVLKFYSRYL